jgi:hypothetical protein
VIKGQRRDLRWTSVRGDGGLLVLAGVLVKADAAGDQDRVYLAVNGAVRRGPINVVHDLPHLVVESLLGTDDGLGAELEAAQHAAARAVTARAAKRQKQGRIVPGAAQGEALSQVADDGTPTGQGARQRRGQPLRRWTRHPAGVRERVARSGDPSVREVLARSTTGLSSRPSTASRSCCADGRRNPGAGRFG